MNQEKYIGMDVHAATISVAVLNTQGKVLMESGLGLEKQNLDSGRGRTFFLTPLPRNKRNELRIASLQ